MKKLIVSVLSVMFLLVSFSVFAGRTGYYNMGIMETAQIMKPGKFMISAADDAGFYYSDFSDKWLMTNEPSAKLAYVIMEGLEASLEYNHAFYLRADNSVTNALGNGNIRIRYVISLGDVLNLSLGAGVGVPLNSDDGALTYTNSPVFQIIPVACLTANLGTVSLHLQIKDLLLMGDSGMDTWLQTKAAIVFDLDGFLAGFTGGLETLSGTSEVIYLGGPEIIWNIAGPLQINIGAYAERFFDATVFRGVFRASLLL